MTAETVEGEIRELPERALAVVAERTQVIMGSASLALMSESDFAANLQALQVQRKRGDEIKRALMAEGTDFGTVPGVPKAFLWKSGAETLDKAFGLVATFDVRRVSADREDVPPYSFHAHALIHVGSADGPVVGEGFGTCNPWETRYRYRNAERVCPSCSKPAVIKGKAEYGGGWLCWKKRDGCGMTWPDGAPAIEGQAAGQVENENPWDLENTIAKMAEKRAHVDGTIRATGTSGLFTQDDDSATVPRGEANADKAPEPLRPGELANTSAEGWAGKVETRSEWLGDLALRPGPLTGFRIKQGRQSIKVQVLGPLAEQVAALAPELVGTTVTAWGTLVGLEFKPDGQTRPVSYQVLRLERLRGPNFDLVAPDDPEPVQDAQQADIEEVMAANGVTRAIDPAEAELDNLAW